MRSRIASEPERRRWFVLAVTVTAQFMVIVDVAVVNVTLRRSRTTFTFPRTACSG